MLSTFRAAIAAIFPPTITRPPVQQLAALCHRRAKNGREVLLVTSSHGRWILPKGWPIAGMNASDAALQEAWEEGGVRKGKVDATALGSFDGQKRYDGGATVPCHTEVFSIEVKSMAKKFPEADRRERIWVAADKAADLVQEDGLRDILRGFAKN